MKRYSICINDTFCQVLDPKSLICPQISCEFGNFNDRKYPKFKPKCLV